MTVVARNLAVIKGSHVRTQCVKMNRDHSRGWTHSVGTKVSAFRIARSRNGDVSATVERCPVLALGGDAIRHSTLLTAAGRKMAAGTSSPRRRVRRDSAAPVFNRTSTTQTGPSNQPSSCSIGFGQSSIRIRTRQGAPSSPRARRPSVAAYPPIQKHREQAHTQKPDSG